MSEQTTEEAEREEIELLLPWYVTGRLNRADTARVESYLTRHPHLSKQLGLARAEREQTAATNEALGSPPPGAIDRLMASLPAARRRAPWSAGTPLFQRVAEFFSAPTANAVRWAAAAAVALIAVQAGAIATLLVGDRGGTYEAATGKQTDDGIPALVVFTDEATAAAISRLLAEFDANIVDGPKPGGVYEIRLRMEDRSQAARAALLRRLAERRDIVRTVLPGRD
jgi:anti-sigma factor RsiW